jgi:NAD(P)H-hydrate repair Nnr-like enzyme with NAD(P)H-hydrate dehydratase domain
LTSSIVLLKGKGTVITDGNKTYINSSGSSALSKAGSGDCLAGLLASLIASAKEPVLELTALSAYVHGAAGDSLAEEFSHFGVTPSDLPREMARILRELEKAKNA